MSLVGRQIGRYRILEQLGQGGMSVVYKGLDTTLDREVAVKVLHPHLASKLESRKRLEREAQAVARLHHPNILEVFDFAGVDAADAYIVTEFIRGKTLRQFLVDEAMQPPEIAAMVVHELASALSHAHDQGVIHRDLKPDNVMVRDDGVIKLMDFGIAKIIDRDEKMTMTGALVGSPAHMAPEIIEGEAAGPEADVFSLGTMLYAFATGKLPFTAPNTTATLKRILDCVYDDPRQVVPTVSDGLAEIIATCLQRQPAARYPSAGKLRDALAELLAEVGITRPNEELPPFFLDPAGYRARLTQRLTTALVAQAELWLGEKKQARAMSALNQVLALDAANARAAELMSRMRTRKARAQRVRRLVQVALGAGLAFIVTMSVAAGVRAANRPPDFTFTPPPLQPTDVVLTGVRWPTRAVEAPVVGPSGEVLPAARLPVLELPPGKRTARTLVPTSQLVNLQVLVRPWGYVRVDDGERSSTEMPRHDLKVAPGPHTFTVTCDACEVAGVTRKEIIAPGATPLTIAIAAPLKPSLVSFEGFPTEAVVRVGAESRTAGETIRQPFRISTPPEGRGELRHRVRYDVMYGGALIEQGEQQVEPGRAVIITPRGKAP
ncbi:MAG: serine/threonine protein kinase [Archangium sp.]|nr:serine/threonine protein kinase [Archangium sp.]